MEMAHWDSLQKVWISGFSLTGIFEIKMTFLFQHSLCFTQELIPYNLEAFITQKDRQDATSTSPLQSMNL